MVTGGHNVDEAVDGDGEAVVLAALPDTDGSLGPSDNMDKLLEGDGDVAVVATLPDADGPGGPSDMDETEGGDGGANLTGLEWEGTTGLPLLEIPLVLDPPGIIDKDDPQLDNNDPQLDLCLQEMMAIKPDTLPSAPDEEWVFKFDFDIKGKVNGGLSNTDMVTSMALAETLNVLKSKHPQGFMLEEHELGPEQKRNPGPPFTVGDIIMCNIWGTAGLQRAFVLLADQPKYWLCLEEGKTIGTHIGEAWLSSRWALGKFAEDQDNPFKEERSDKRLKLGSYGILVDSQIKLLRKTRKARNLPRL